MLSVLDETKHNEKSNNVSHVQQTLHGSKMIQEVSSLTPLPKNEDSHMADVSDLPLDQIKIVTAIEEEEENDSKSCI